MNREHLEWRKSINKSLSGHMKRATACCSVATASAAAASQVEKLCIYNN